MFMQLHSSQQALQKELSQSMVIYQIAGLTFGPSCKACPCLNVLLAAAFPATWCYCSLRMQNKHCRKKNKKNKCSWDQLGSNCNYRCKDRIMDRKIRKKLLVLCNSFCKVFFAFESCKNTALLEMLLPARKSDKFISWKRGEISTLWSRFPC